jgi:hypothetical protein
MTLEMATAYTEQLNKVGNLASGEQGQNNIKKATSELLGLTKSNG